MTTWLNLKHIVSEITQKEKYCMDFVLSIHRSRNKLTYKRESRMVVTRVQRVERKGKFQSKCTTPQLIAGKIF